MKIDLQKRWRFWRRLILIVSFFNHTSAGRLTALVSFGL